MIRQAVILVGGKGTRLGALTAEMPKPLLEIGGQPFLDYLLFEVARHGVTDVILLAGHGADLVRARYDGREIAGAKVRCVVEPEAAGTGGALRQASASLDPWFFLLNGDSIFDINMHDLALDAERRGSLGHLALLPVGDARRSGAVALDGSRIVAFAARGSGPAIVNGGVYVLRRDIVEFAARVPLSLENEIFPALAARGQLSGKVYDDRFFIDIGVPTDFAAAQTAIPRWARRPAVFFDRDGVLNVDTGYVHRSDEFRWVDGAPEAVRAVNDSGRLAVVVTNQAGVARGLYDEAAVDRLHDWMNRELAARGAHIDGFYFCPHHPDIGEPPYRQACDCRKPGTGLLRRAMVDLPIDMDRSLLIGDRPSDLEAAAAMALPGHHFDGGNLRDFVAALLARDRPGRDVATTP